MALVRAIENFTTAQKKLWSQNYGVKSVRVDGPLWCVHITIFFTQFMVELLQWEISMALTRAIKFSHCSKLTIIMVQNMSMWTHHKCASTRTDFTLEFWTIIFFYCTCEILMALTRAIKFSQCSKFENCATNSGVKSVRVDAHLCCVHIDIFFTQFMVKTWRKI